MAFKPSSALNKCNDKHSSGDVCNKIGLTYDFVFVDEESFNNYNPKLSLTLSISFVSKRMDEPG